MALDKKHLFSIFVSKTLWILLIVFHDFNLVICDELEDDNLKKALEAIERRQRDLDLQENDYYGQPENIGYGFQKTLGFFDSNGPSTEFGSYNSDPKSENEFQNILYNFYKERDNEKRKTNFRERMSNYRINYPISNRNEADEYSQSGIEYLQLLKNLWSKYRQSQNDDLNVEDLTDEQLEEFLNSINSLNDKGIDEERFVNDYDSAESNDYKHYESIPLRSRKNYRVFEGLSNRRKRYPSFGEGIYGKRSFHSQQNNYENPTENDFLYSLKYITPEVNREAAENLREGGFEVLGDEKDRNVLRILNGALNRPKYFEDDEPYWSKEQNPYDDELWLQGPVTFPDDWYDNSGRNEKRMEVAPKYFKPHNGIHLNSKRFPVKRSSIRVRKEVKSDKDAKELKGIFGTSETTTIPPKKGNEKKPTETVKKQNVTKPAVTKHYEGKKVVRSTDKYTKERVLPARQNEEIADLFSPTKKLISKKSIDWSQYFGIDKRSHPNWLKNDYLARAESHFLAPKNKRFFPSEAAGIGSGSFLDRPQYQMPFDTRKFNKKSYPTDIGSNIDKVENKIGDIEEKIIDDALKYTGAHSGYGSDDLSKVKSRVIQHLEAAYSLEKMKNALEEFKNLIKPDKSSETINLPKKTTTEAPKSEPQTTAADSKEKSNLEKPLLEKKPNIQVNKEVVTKKESVKDIFNRDSSENLEFLNYPSYQDRSYDNEECPLLDQILHTCLRIEGLGGRYAELLVPLCSLQQICYICGNEIGFSKMSMCDSMYLTEAQSICQDNSECLVSARDSLVALRDLYEQDFFNKNSRRLLSGSCLSNPCIQRYFLNSPGAIYSLEVQN